MPTTYSHGYLAKLGFHDTATPTVATEFVSEGIRKVIQHAVRQGIRGTRSQVAADVREGIYTVSGPIVLEPLYAELAAFMPRIMGSGSVLSDTIPDFHILKVFGGKSFEYPDCKIARATLSGSPGRLVTLSMDIVGKTETHGTTTLADVPDYGEPFIFHDSALTLDGTVREVFSWELTIDNGLLADRFVNSQSLSVILEGERTITLTVNLAYSSDNQALYPMSKDGITGTNTLVLADGTHTCTFTFPCLQTPPESPTVQSGQEVMLPLTLIARRTADVAEMTYSGS